MLFMFLIIILLKLKKFRDNFFSPLKGIIIFLCPDQNEVTVIFVIILDIY